MATISNPPPQVVVFPMERQFSNGTFTLYYWSTWPEGPFIRGEQERDWHGGFKSAEEATENAKRHLHSPALGAKTLPFRTAEDEPQLDWPATVKPYTLEISIPLDEFSERAFSDGYQAAELRDLLECLDARVRPDPLVADKVLVLNGRPAADILYHRFQWEEGKVTFALPLTVSLQSEQGIIGIADVPAKMIPVVRLDPLYPDFVKAALIPRS